MEIRITTGRNDVSLESADTPGLVCVFLPVCERVCVRLGMGGLGESMDVCVISSFHTHLSIIPRAGVRICA